MKVLKVERFDEEGSYYMPLAQAGSIVDAEFFYSEPGDAIKLTLVEMSEAACLALPISWAGRRAVT